MDPFAWISKSELGLITIPIFLVIKPANSLLLVCLILSQFSRKAALLTNFSKPRILVKSLTQPLPMASLIKLARRGLISSKKRRGVMPLVLLLNFSGSSS